jgi:D-lactate dehydrogenase
MLDKKRIANFDAYLVFNKLLYGQNFTYPLNKQTATKVPQPEQYRAISVKSLSLVDLETLKNFPNLKLLITRTVGMEHIDLRACQQTGIVVKNIPDYGPFTVAEHTWAMLLALTRRICELNTLVHCGVFRSREAIGYSLEGKTLGVIGAGRIGLEVIRLAKAFKMTVLAFDIHQNDKAAHKLKFKYVSLDQLLATSDVVTSMSA